MRNIVDKAFETIIVATLGTMMGMALIASFYGLFKLAKFAITGEV